MLKRLMLAFVVQLGVLAASAGGAAAGPPDQDAERVRFDPGTSQATIRAALDPSRDARYVLEAAAGQVMSVIVAPDAGSAGVAVAGPNGAALGASGLAEWTGALPSDGDYLVTVSVSENTGLDVTFRIVDDATLPATNAPSGPLPLPPTGTTLSNPIEIRASNGRLLTDGRYATPLPADATVAIAEDGRVIAIDEATATVLGPDGTMLASAPCPGCRGVVLVGDSALTVRDPRNGPTFELVELETVSLTEQRVVVAERAVAADGQGVDDGREWWDTPVLLAVDPAGFVVAYDYRPGGTNARGGDEAVIARYTPEGALSASTVVSGSITRGVISPDGSHVALAFSGSFGACHSVSEGAALDLASLVVSLPEPADTGTATRWFQLHPYWDGPLLRLNGALLEEPTSTGASCEGITATPWEASLDPATGEWRQGPSSGLTRWVGPSCTDVIEISSSLTGVASIGHQVVARVDGVSRDLGLVEWVDGGSGLASCTAGTVPTASDGPPATPTSPSTTIAPTTSSPQDVCATPRIAADLGLDGVEQVELCGSGWAYVDPGGEGDIQFIARLRGARWWREILFPSPYCPEQVQQMGMPQPLIDRVNWGCTGSASIETPQIVPGESGDRVRSLQQELVDRGAAINVDGHFGPGTQGALMEAQRTIGLVEADGYAGPATQAVLGIGDMTGSPYATADEFVDDLTSWLNGGLPGDLPADATTSLFPTVATEPSVASWEPNGISQALGDRRVVTFVLSGSGGISTVLDVCVTEAAPIRWCGVWSLRAH